LKLSELSFSRFNFAKEIDQVLQGFELFGCSPVHLRFIDTDGNPSLIQIARQFAEIVVSEMKDVSLGQAFHTIQDGIISYLQVTYHQLVKTIRRVGN
jgi:hypothetical protein